MPLYDIAEGTEETFLLELTNLKRYLGLVRSNALVFICSSIGVSYSEVYA